MMKHLGDRSKNIYASIKETSEASEASKLSIGTGADAQDQDHGQDLLDEWNWVKYNKNC